MYERIFEDLEHVKEVLASHGHNSVDSTLVFELLEKYRVPDDVVKILLGNLVRPNQVQNSSDNSWNSERSLSPKETVAIRPDNSVYLSATVNDSDSSDDLEVLEHNLAKDARRRDNAIEPVDLTLEEIQEVRFSKSKSQNVFPNLPETKIQSMLRDESPAPIYPGNCKRKQDEDDCPLPVKKFTPEESSSPEIKAAEAVPKSSVVKPAKLTIPETKALVLKPSKLTPPSSKPELDESTQRIDYITYNFSKFSGFFLFSVFYYILQK